MLNGFWQVIAWIATFGCFIAGIFTGTNNMDFTANYKKNVKSVEIYENDFDSALPQTDMYKLINDHVNSPLPEGKTSKKVIVIGYDGCRADNLAMCEDDGGIMMLQKEGSAALSYCGGVNYPQINKQDTSTAPGWCSMLIGKWAGEIGVTGNGMPKSNDYLTLLTTLVEDEKIDSSAFYVSWGGHFDSDDSTYINERHYVEEKGLNVNMLKADDDNGTKKNVLDDVTKADCSDFIFSIFEYCDHTGHDSGFCMNNPEIVKAFADQEETAAEVINAVKARETYDEEDWLIIITSDHGGYNSWHGGPTMQERYTFIVANKELVEK